jgi:antirestriction protein
MYNDNKEYQIYVTDLKDYVNGSLIGYWLDITELTVSDIKDNIQSFLHKRTEQTNELHEEFFITDYENITGFGEYPNLEDLAEHIELLNEHGEAWSEYVNYIGAGYATVENFNDIFNGSWDSELDFAEQLFDECYLHELPEHLQYYIDYDSFRRDIFSGDFYYSGGYVFRAC